ncbi:MAG: site-specific integrase [Thiobacillus sp.]|nr:site-specific integrase [Thiobacillus sp.]
MGSVTKIDRNDPKTRWRASVRKKGYPPAFGRFDTEREALDWVAVIESEMIRGVYVSTKAAEAATVAALLQKYRDDELPQLRGKGWGPALNALEDGLGGYSLAALSGKAVADYKKKRLKHVADDTVRKEINLLSRIIDLSGNEWGIKVPANPCREVKRPPTGEQRSRRLEGDEMDRLLKASETRVGWLARFATETAARLGELLAVQWRDIDTEKRVMVIRGIERRGTKNGDASREVPLTRAAVAVLDELKSAAKPSQKLPDARVFHWWSASDGFTKTWRRACIEAKIEDLRFHDLRHEATSRLAEYLPLLELAKATGHKDPRMIMRYYHPRAEDSAKKLP